MLRRSCFRVDCPQGIGEEYELAAAAGWGCSLKSLPVMIVKFCAFSCSAVGRVQVSDLTLRVYVLYRPVKGIPTLQKLEERLANVLKVMVISPHDLAKMLLK
jgi:hypothetical protein